MKNEALWGEVVTTRSDAARVAYKEWLETTRQVERARLISVQLETAETLRSPTAAAWASTVSLEREARTLLRANAKRWQQEERYESLFHWKGFPGRIQLRSLGSDALANLSALPIEHAIIAEAVDSSVLDHLLAANVRALTLIGERADEVGKAGRLRQFRAHELFRDLCNHLLLHRLVWLRTEGMQMTAGHWDALEAANPQRLLYVDPSGDIGLEVERSLMIDDPGALNYTGAGFLFEVGDPELMRPCWRCPATTWGPRPTIARVLGYADAMADGSPMLKPAAHARQASLWSEVMSPRTSFEQEASPDGWNPTNEWMTVKEAP